MKRTGKDVGVCATESEMGLISIVAYTQVSIVHQQRTRI